MVAGVKLGSATITLVRRVLSAEQDSYGNDMHTTVEVPIAGCLVYPRMSAEGSVAAAAQVITGLWVLAPTGEPILPTDAVRVDGREYEVDEQPGIWATPTGTVAMQQVALKEVTG